MVENSKLASQSLTQNKALLNAEHCEIINMDAMQFLSRNKQKSDIIFCDPPYSKQWLNKVLPSLHQHLTVEG
jgi:16S rRNA G966 N2-methylase RsmD